MHNLDQPHFQSEPKRPDENVKMLSEAERARAKTNLDLRQFQEELAVEDVTAKLLAELITQNPETRRFLNKNNKE